mmetsp:Transcript_16255/g.38402  ORF Transcript_16255/g.38402 Transcript_16255/m.38402 type:complete len:216 (-) Transcript_16255:2-649(-)
MQPAVRVCGLVESSCFALSRHLQQVFDTGFGHVDGLLAIVGLEGDIGLVLQQKLHDLLVSRLGRLMQRRPAACRLGIDVAGILLHQLHDFVELLVLGVVQEQMLAFHRWHGLRFWAAPLGLGLGLGFRLGFQGLREILLAPDLRAEGLRTQHFSCACRVALCDDDVCAFRNASGDQGACFGSQLGGFFARHGQGASEHDAFAVQRHGELRALLRL